MNQSIMQPMNHPIMQRKWDPTQFNTFRSTMGSSKSNFKWYVIFSLIVLVLCLWFIPGAPIYNLIKDQNIITYLVPANSNILPSMTQDSNYRAVVNDYKDGGFSTDNYRNTAITIVGKFMVDNNMSDDISGFSNEKLYSILTATSVDDAISKINS